MTRVQSIEKLLQNQKNVFYYIAVMPNFSLIFLWSYLEIRDLIKKYFYKVQNEKVSVSINYDTYFFKDLIKIEDIFVRNILRFYKDLAQE